jgi:tetratricopeptide (TPR) repeat protein
MAISYHQLGRLAQLRGQLDEAEAWYRKSLEIEEKLGDRPGMARGYHQLGRLAQLRGQLDEAEAWYRKSLEIDEKLGNRPGMAVGFGQLGLLAEERRRPAEALEWTVKCVALFDEFPHPATGHGPSILARLTAALGIDALEQCWQAVAGASLPPAVRDFVISWGPDRGD